MRPIATLGAEPTFTLALLFSPIAIVEKPNALAPLPIATEDAAPPCAPLPIATTSLIAALSVLLTIVALWPSKTDPLEYTSPKPALLPILTLLLPVNLRPASVPIPIFSVPLD